MLTLRGSNGARRGTELGELGIVPDGAVLIADGMLQEVGSTRRLENLTGIRDAVEINASGCVVMPGFVDCHTHLAFPSIDTADGSAEDSLRSFKSGTGQRLWLRARLELEAMARHGTTTVEVKSSQGPLDPAQTKLLRVLRELRSDPIDVFSTFFFRLAGEDLNASHEAAALWVTTELLPKLRRRRLARFADVAWDARPTCHARFDRYLRAAAALGFPRKVHADQRPTSVAVRMAIAHGAASIDHLDYASAEDAALLGDSNLVAVMLPCASFHSGSRFAPARELIQAGAAVALGSNFSPDHTPALSMQTVISFAHHHLKMSPEEAIVAATINGAHALGRAARSGSLQIGKSADLLILNVPDYRDLANRMGDNLVRMTMKRGRVIYHEGQVVRPPDRIAV